jgi:deoxyribonuclease (pyrimidine dimer)
MDQHLFAEFREIKMVPKSLARSLAAARKRKHCEASFFYDFWGTIPKDFTLNKGHVSFFYDKGVYLSNRYLDLRLELTKRGINFDRTSQLDPDGVFGTLDHNFLNNYAPTPEALAIIRERIEQRLALRPGFYRYYGKVQQ